ncbi:hypothetical protein, partial [Nonomuraea sp. NPDC003201]
MSRRRPLLTALAVVALVVLVTTGGPALSASLGTTTTPAVSALAATAGCGKAPGLASGTRSIQTSGKNRSYILKVPDNYDMNHPYRLIFGL